METLSSGSFQNHLGHDSMRQENNADHHVLPKRAPYHHEGYKAGKPKENTPEIVLLRLTTRAPNSGDVP
jgi:hypothetical protein